MKEEKKPRDLTLGAYHPAEKFQELGDGTKVRLEDPTHKKPQKEIEREHAGESEGH